MRNPAGVSKGVASLFVDDQAVAGNLVPLACLRNGAKIVATLG